MLCFGCSFHLIVACGGAFECETPLDASPTPPLVGHTHILSRPSSAQVRARLEKKLDAQQKTGFAFNFEVENDAADLQEEEVPGEANAGEKGSFRFGFNPSNTNEIDASTPTKSERRGGGGEASRGADQDFSIEIEQRRAHPQGKHKPKGKRAGKKKKKGGKEKGEAAGQESRESLIVEPPETVAATGSSTALSNGREEISNSVSLPVAEAKDGNPDLSRASPTPGVAKTDVVGARRVRAPLRPPPGFTLESWKDPTLSGEERRRRRFGSGVRNMAAIQRRSDARREMAGNDELEVDGSESHCAAREAAQGNVLVEGGIPADARSGVAGGSSVFAFGFDIGISFDGGT